jgi:Protein of unknown function (DUF3347)
MKTINQLICMMVTLLSFTFNSCDAQKISNIKNETIKVYGNCEKCKKTIELAANKKGTSKAVWDKNTKILSLSYDSIKTTNEVILKKIALAGYDNEKFIAPDNAYSKLDGCCQYERAEKKTTTPAIVQTIIKDTTSTNAIEKQVPINPLAEVYAAYFSLKDALTKDDGITASAKATALYKAIDNVKMETMTAAQHTLWMKYLQDISYNAEHIKSTTENEHQREHFAKLSIAMIEVIKIIKPEYTVYVEHCPMYNNNKGADWASKENGIKNPYYGATMLSCGSVSQTIK